MKQPPARRSRSSPASGKGARDVAALLDAANHPLRPLIDELRALVAAAVPSALESIKWNAPSFATSEHFATFHLRGKTGVQLVLHRGAQPRARVDMRAVLPETDDVLIWKGPDRAIVHVRDAAHLKQIRKVLSQVVRAWSKQVG